MPGGKSGSYFSTGPERLSGRKTLQPLAHRLAGIRLLGVFNVIPKLEKFLVAIGRKLPAMTQSLLDITRFIQTYLPYVATGLTVTVVALTALYL